LDAPGPPPGAQPSVSALGLKFNFNAEPLQQYGSRAFLFILFVPR
jgi:hypothetical protein